MNVLEISSDTLKRKMKKIFVDIACFFNREDQVCVKKKLPSPQWNGSCSCRAWVRARDRAKISIWYLIHYYTILNYISLGTSLERFYNYCFCLVNVLNNTFKYMNEVCFFFNHDITTLRINFYIQFHFKITIYMSIKTVIH